MKVHRVLWGNEDFPVKQQFILARIFKQSGVSRLSAFSAFFSQRFINRWILDIKTLF